MAISKDTFEYKKTKKVKKEEPIKNVVVSSSVNSNVVVTGPNKDTYEYKDEIHRPNLVVDRVEMGICSKNTLMEKLTKPINGRFYHTNDTNEFFMDWNDQRYKLDISIGGNGGNESSDLSSYAKKTDIPTRTSQLVNDSNFLTVTSLGKFLNDNNYLKRSDFEAILNGFVSKTDFNVLKSDVDNSKGRIEALENYINNQRGDVAIGSESITTGTGIRIDNSGDTPVVYVYSNGTETRLDSSGDNDWDAFEQE